MLVVGAGRIAARKVEGLAAAGARVRVVAPAVSAALDRALVDELRERPFEAAGPGGVRLVVTATGSRAVDAAVAAAATAAGIWVNAADQPEDCSFILPAIARNGPLTVAVSTGGASPALARRLRDHAGRLLTDDVVALAQQLAAERARVRATGGSTEDVDWAPAIDPVLPPVDRPSECLSCIRVFVRGKPRTKPSETLGWSDRGGRRGSLDTFDAQFVSTTLGVTNREDQGRDPLGGQHALERRGDRARRAQGQRGAGQDRRVRPVPLRRAPDDR